jgi:hypothetical protein
MNLRSTSVLTLVLLTGCPAEKPAAAPPPAEVQPPAMKPMEARVGPPEALDAGAVAQPAVDAGASAAPEPVLVETEIFGVATLGAVKSAKTVLVANKAPCVPVPEQLDVWGVENVAKPAKLFGEVFVADGTPVYFCVYALDAKGAVVGAAQEAGSPRTIVGPEEVMLKDVRFTLEPVRPAVTPKGFAP